MSEFRLRLDSPLLLIGQSARMLAESAARGGFGRVAIDLFGDEDTRRVVDGWAALPLTASGLDLPWLEMAVERLLPSGGAFVYGSGIDTRPEAVARLSQRLRCLGNTPAVLRRLNEPAAFFPLLRRLEIPFPETHFTAPASGAGWLVKRGCGEGGKGVGFLAKNRPAAAEEYFQRHIPGSAHSVLFLADGENARIVGFNTLWVDGSDPVQPFLFAGAVNRADLTHRQVAALQVYVSRLTAEVGLVGLNSLDFVCDGATLWVLEVNPRPSASMALHDADYPLGLLAAHVDACRGVLPEAASPPAPVRGFRVVTAPRGLHVGERWSWPSWCADRPGRGVKVAAGQPLCTVHAQASDGAAVEDMLRARMAGLLARLNLNESPAQSSAPAE